jgi:membrane protease YdiL (CAAX protease family)
MSGPDSSLPTEQPAPILSAPSGPTPRELELLKFPEDLRTLWGWKEILIFVLASIGLYFGVALVVVIIFIAAGQSVETIQNSARVKALFGVIATLIVSVAQLGFLYLFMNRPPGESFWHAIGWRSLRSGNRRPRFGPPIYMACGCVFAILISVASKAAGQPHGMPIEIFWHDRLSASLFLILGVTIAPFVEETIFRGFIYPVAARSFGIAGSIVFTGIIFGLLHGPQLWGAWAQIALLIVVGIVFTFVRAKTGTVFASYLFHLGYNGWLFAAFLGATHFLKNLPGPQ